MGEPELQQRVVQTEEKGRRTFIQRNALTGKLSPPPQLESRPGGRVAPWPRRLRCCTALKLLLFLLPGCSHVPPAVSHFEPVSNGGPRPDPPSGECVLLLVRPTPRSFCPPEREVRRRGGEAECAGRERRASAWGAGFSGKPKKEAPRIFVNFHRGPL